MKTVAGGGKKKSEILGRSGGGAVQRKGRPEEGLGFWVQGSGQRFLGTTTETEQKENEEQDEKEEEEKEKAKKKKIEDAESNMSHVTQIGQT